ncbi:unnamed protein product [Gongylonema pulchrum]|uniref:Uncharacterized protein n=1 Tax=Gongylonema pulchrum TaxID=637853 RepID=A0A183D0K1_9BILA|nr:unnamed protein product [Gongylonema pulchrum]
MRALLTSKSSQGDAYDLLLKKIENLSIYRNNAGDDRVSKNRLALACIAQSRYLEVIYDCKRAFNAVFDCDLENWCHTPRDALIHALPEMLPFPGIQEGNFNENE